ncbi:Scr1 family TA system antitoxin-like transcriptional regulator [Actinomadura viridis]|uniref:helix-turn-helix domain-containing protein n=1 Tax=Actinomadura viridis TaxID=58110 RepID=UPI0036C9160B
MPELDPKKSLQAVYARALARERTRAKLTQDQLGGHPAVMVSGKLIGHVENCRRPPTIRLSTGLDKALDLEEFFESLYIHWADEEGPPSAIWEYFDLEYRANSIKVYAPSAITGLLQSEDYARAVFKGAHRAERVEELVTARVSRQEILRREPPPWLLVLIEEDVLRRVVGGREVMRHQLESLLTVIQEPNVTILVVPSGAPVYPGGAFTLLGFPDSQDIGFVESSVATARSSTTVPKCAS